MQITAPAIRLVDESFDIEKSGSYHLSILSSEKNLAFTILDTSINKYIALQIHPSDPSKEGEFVPFWSKEKAHFKSVTCAIAHNKFTLIPSALFDDEKKESFLGFNHPVDKNEKVYSNKLNNVEASNVFTLSLDFESRIRKHFINAHFIHDATSFMEGLLIENKNNTGKKVFANFSSSCLEIVILDGRDLLFSNAFHYKVAEDIAYYTLFVYEQLHLNPEDTELVISGEIEKTAEEHALLYNYIRRIKFATRPNEFTYSYKLEEMPSHNLFSLFTQYLCV